jgi:DNA primase catalytic subunit
MYLLPEGMRYASLKERKKFYRDEFNLSAVESWFKEREGKTVFAVIIGRHTKIYPKKYRDSFSDTILIDEYSDLSEVHSLIVDFLPEGVYYDRNLYKSLEKCIKCSKNYIKCWGCRNLLGQELAFDLDPENLTCPIHGSLEDKMKRRQGLGFCEVEYKMVRTETAKLYEELVGRFSNLKIVYSGRGFHIHVFDKETLRWGFKRRRGLAKELIKKGFLIDEWVTSGGMRLIRLPYSLHGMVSRIVVPLDYRELGGFDAVKDRRCVPKFLR